MSYAETLRAWDDLSAALDAMKRDNFERAQEYAGRAFLRLNNSLAEAQDVLEDIAYEIDDEDA